MAGQFSKKDYQAALRRCVSAIDLEVVILRCLDLAQAGERWAAELILSHCLGKPPQDTPAVTIAPQVIVYTEPARVFAASLVERIERDGPIMPSDMRGLLRATRLTLPEPDEGGCDGTRPTDD